MLLCVLSPVLGRDLFDKRFEDIHQRHERGYYQKSSKIAQKILDAEAQKPSPDRARQIYAHGILALDQYRFSHLEAYAASMQKAESLFAQLPNDSAKQLVMAGRELAEVYMALGQYNKALAYSEKAYQAGLNLDANNVAIRRAGNTYLRALIKNGFLSKALQVFEAQMVGYDKFLREEQLLRNKRGEYEVAALKKGQLAIRKNLYVDFNLVKAQLLTQRGENAQSIQFIFDNIDVFANKEQFVKACKELGDALLGVGEYQKAEDYYQRATKASKISNHSDFEMHCRTQLNKTYASLDQDKAFRKNNKKLYKATKYFPRENVMRLLPEYNTVQQYLNQERFSRASEVYGKLQEKITLAKIYPTDLFWIDMRELQNLLFLKNYQTKELVDSTLSLYNAYQGVYAKGAPELHFKKMALASIYTNFSNEFSKSQEIIDSSFHKNVVREYSSTHPRFHTFLSTIGDYYDLNEAYDSASFYYHAAAQSANECFGDYHSNYIIQLEKSANMYLKLGDYNHAKEEATLAKEMVGKAEGNKKKASIETYQTLGRIYQALGMYGDAKAAFRKAYGQSAHLKYEREASVARSADDKAEILIQTGNYQEAERLLLNGFEIKKNLFGLESKELIGTHQLLGSLYLVTGKYGDAEKQLLASEEIVEKVFGNTSLRYANALLQNSKLNLALGDIDKALNNALKAQELIVQKLGAQHLKTAEAYNEIALLKYHKGGLDDEVAQDLAKAMEINKSVLGEDHPKYAENLYALGLLRLHQGQYDEAAQLLDQSQKIWISRLGRNQLQVADIELWKGDLAKYKKDYVVAENSYNAAKQIYERLFSSSHPQYVRALSRLGQIYYIEGKYDKSLKILEKTTAQYLAFTQKYFNTLSFNQKAKFWEVIKSDFEFYNSLGYKLLGNKPDITGYMYDHIIQTKHILMGSSSMVLQSVIESKDPMVKSKYTEWMHKRVTMTNHLVNGSEDENFNLQKLEKEIEALEKELAELSTDFRNDLSQHKQKPTASWKEIQKKLKPNEYAVEILRYRDFREDFTDSVVYGALVISPNTMPPQYIKLQYGNKLEQKYLNYYRNAFKQGVEDKHSYKMFWSDIKTLIPNGAKVYLSPEGVFDQINVETLYNLERKTYVMDENHIVLLTNTNDLVQDTWVGAKPKKTAILCGNPEFYPESKSEGHISQLKGAEHEVQTIGNVLKNKGWDTHIILYASADRDSLFKDTSPGVFHIATHGYFKQDLEKRRSLGNASIVQNPLLRSGILLKGAGDALENNNKKSVGGIFTAYEAMEMNFNNTELVVLSACETALGDVQVGEGVQGLQMGLFVAGAKNIVMSLFKVNDAVTDQFMTLFYEKWAQSNDLQGAFRAAVEEVRKQHPEPRDWGAFILMRR